MNNIVASAKIKFLDWYLAGGAEDRPSGWSIALHTGDPGIYGDQNELTTDDDPDYERKDVTWSLPASFQNGTSVCLNNEDLTWIPGAEAAYDVAAMSVRDENGEPIAWSIFSEVTEATDGIEFRIYADSVAVVIDDACQKLRESLLLYLFSVESMTQASGVIAALHTDNPGTDGADNEVTLTQDADYVRKLVAFSSSSEISDTGKVKIASDWTSWTPAATSPGYTVTWTTYRDSVTGECLAVAQRLKEMVMTAGVPSPGTTGEILAY
jgi:hypothetical protein